MAVKVKFKLTISPALREAMRTALANDIVIPYAARIADAARSLAPVKSGKLRNSIMVSIRTMKWKVVAKIGSPLRYARRIEFGFVGRDRKGRNYSQGPRAFLRNALSRIWGGEQINVTERSARSKRPKLRLVLRGK